MIHQVKLMYNCFEVLIENNIAHIKLNRPQKRNSITNDFWRELPEIIEDIDNNSKARVVVISSSGPHFCSGLDLSSFGSMQDLGSGEKKEKLQRNAAFYDNVLHLQKSFSCLEEARIPVLACIQGGAIGGGVDLAVACDIRYATKDAFMAVHETNIGMTADVGTFPRLVKLIPEGFVKEMAYTGRRVPAQEAKNIGLINEVYEDQETMMKEVMEIAIEIASKAPLAVYGCKKMINYARDHNTADGLDYVAIWNASMFKPEEISEAMSSNAEKRIGDFASLPKSGKTRN
jgi:enoyl-CoA hydratase